MEVPLWPVVMVVVVVDILREVIKCGEDNQLLTDEMKSHLA